MTKKRPKNKPTKAAQSSAAAPEQSKIEDELDMLEDIKRDEDLYISESDVANISNFIRTTNKSFNSLGNIVVEKFNGRCSLAILHALIALFDTDSREREDVIRRLNIIYIVWRLPEMEAELRLKPQKNMTDIYSHPFSTFLFYAEQLEHVAESILARIIVTNNAGVIEKLTAPDFIQKAGKLDVYKVDRDAWEDFEIKNTAHWPEITEEMVSLAKAMRELGCERKDHEAGMAEAFYPLVHNPPTMLPPRMMPLGQEDPRMAAYRKIKDEDNPNLVADVLYSMTAGDDIQERIKEAFGDLEQTVTEYQAEIFSGMTPAELHEAQQIITYEDGKMLPSSDSEVYSESDSDSYDERAAEADFRALTAAAGASIELNDKVIAGCVDRILVGHALTTTKTEMMILFVKSCNLTHPQYDRLLSATRTDDSIILFIRTNVKFAGAFLVRNALSEQGGCELFKRYRSRMTARWCGLLAVVAVILLIGGSEAAREALLDDYGEFLPHIRLAKDLMDPRRYDSRVRPVMNHSKPTTVSFSMSLYQILSINEKQQNVDLNVWAIQKWNDDFLGWNPYLYGMINTTILPFDAIWLPDTYLYNSVVMNREETERYINVVVTTNYWKGEKGAEVKFMYPALYRTSCLLDIRFFPYDQQACKLTISSWTSSKSDINYVPEYESVNMDNFLPNEEWVVVSFNVKRIEEKFVCCPEPWVLLEAVLVVRRKPLYYIVNLVIPTSVITLVAVTGFFTAASTSSERREKLSLGIDSLLAMSILMMMVSEQMPTSSDFVPLFGIFYLSIIFIIFIGTLFTAFILNVHLQKMYAKPVSPVISYIFFGRIALWLRMRPPTMLLELWNETGVSFGKMATKKRCEVKKKLPKVTSVSSGLNLITSSGKGRAPLAAPISARSYISMDDTKREAARRNWRRLMKKVTAQLQSQKQQQQHQQNGLESIKKNGGGERGQLRQAGRRKAPPPPAVALPHAEPGPLMLSASAISAFSMTGDSTILESKLKRRYALEWEYLASVLDRVLLIVFSLVVFFVTSIMILVGEAMHLSYELAAKEL